MRLIDADALKLADFQDFSNTDVMYAIDHTPTIGLVKRGKWTQTSAFDEDANIYVCSECDEPWTLINGTPRENNMNYCPNCGARMN